MWNWALDFWKKYISGKIGGFWYDFLKPKINSLLDNIRGLLGKKIEEERPAIEKELQKEKEELKKEIPTNSKSYIEKLKELLK
jgi:hypothetical protein